MERGFKYRIYPNESQRNQIARTLGCCRFVYNRALDKVEEAADIKAYNEALMEDDGTRYSMDDIMRMAMEAE